MIILDSTPMITHCDFRKFQEGELHINRLCNFYVLILMLDGTLIFHEDGKEITLTKGEWYIQRAGGSQEGITPSLQPHYFYIHFEIPNLESKWTNMFLKMNERGCFQPAYYMDNFIKLDRYKTRSNLEIFEYQRIFMNVLKDLIEETNQNATSAETLLNKMLEYIENNFNADNLPKELERKYQFSYTTLCKLTKEHVGMTPVQYMTNIRLAKASDLLKRTSQTVDVIAATVGYSDLSVFFKAFKKHYGLPPGEYRKLNRIHEY